MQVSQTNIFYGFITIIGLVALFYYLKNKTAKFQALIDYSVIKLKLVKMGLFTTDLRASILIKNPADIGVTINDYIVEVYHINPSTKVRKMIVKSAPANMVIKPKANIINDVDFSLQNFDGISTLLNIIKQENTTSLQGQFSFVIKGSIQGIFFTKEVLY